MPKIISGLAPDELIGAPRIYYKPEIKKILRWGEGKYQRNKHLIDRIRINGRDACTPEALTRFLKAHTIKAKP
jgi:hypothetical protein